MNREYNTVQDTLVILTPGFPKDEEDSVCLPAQQQFVRALNTCFPDLRIIIVSFQYPYGGPGAFATGYEWHGNRVLPLHGNNRGGMQRLLTWCRAWAVLRKLKRRHRAIGLLSLWCTECALVGHYFSKLYRLPHFTWILGQDARLSNRFFIRLIRPAGKELIAMSDFLSQEFFRNHAIQPQHMIPNGVDQSLYESAPVGRDIDLLGAGSLIPLKRYDLFIRLAAEIAAAFPALKACICGMGPEYDRLKVLIAGAGLEKDLVLAGEKPHAEVLRSMQRAKIFLHTSSYEGFSSVCLEALYAGAHVISICRPMTMGIDHWHIVADEKEMIGKIRELLSDPGLDHRPILVNSVENSARQMMQLFGYRERASS